MEMFGHGLAVLVLCALTAAGDWLYTLHGQNEECQILSHEGVLIQIRQMNRLESTAFYIDTIIRTEKKGGWRRLWRDPQSDISIVHDKVLAGLDLDKLGTNNVNVMDGKVLISLPTAEILSVDLESIEVYNIQTGSFNLLPMDKSVFETVQEEARRQVLQNACKAEILEHANHQAQVQLENLFALTRMKMPVYPTTVGRCGQIDCLQR